MSRVGFYIGIAECGCVRGLLVDDERTTAGEIAEFAERQAQMNRRMKHVPAGQKPPGVNPDCTEHARKKPNPDATPLPEWRAKPGKEL